MPLNHQLFIHLRHKHTQTLLRESQTASTAYEFIMNCSLATFCASLHIEGIFSYGMYHADTRVNIHCPISLLPSRSIYIFIIFAGVFLVCWVPFFTCNIMDAMCTKLNYSCQPGVTAFILTTWLGWVLYDMRHLMRS